MDNINDNDDIKKNENENENINDDETSVEEFLNSTSYGKDKITITKQTPKTVHIEKPENNSGMGEVAPYSITKYFNWGTFLFNWIWGLKYKKFTLLLVPLLCFIPYGFIVAIIYALWAGTKGNQWAWEEVQYKNEEDFHASQREWVRIWLVLAGIVLIIGLPLYLFTTKSISKTAPKDEETNIFDNYNPKSTLELSIPEEVLKNTDSKDSNADLFLNDKYIIYWMRPENDQTITNKNFIEEEFNKNKEELGDSFILYPDIKKLNEQNTEIIDIDVNATCINSTCINKWLYENCDKGYCIINPMTRKYYKVWGTKNIIPKAIYVKTKWGKK